MWSKSGGRKFDIDGSDCIFRGGLGCLNGLGGLDKLGWRGGLVSGCNG